MILWLVLLLLPVPVLAQSYPWLAGGGGAETVRERFAPPSGCHRKSDAPAGFGEWLRALPLKPASAPVRLYNGTLKGRQDVHAAVVNIDAGTRDLQQCADAVIRLRAEYLYSRKLYDAIRFDFTNGTPALFRNWREGQRPVVRGNNVRWTTSAQPDSSHTSFRKYLDTVFQYAGSYSLSKELKPVSDPREMQVGDVFIQGGFPGHAVIVVDMAVCDEGDPYFLLAQSYMPAQEIHVLKNPSSGAAPWYLLKPQGDLVTPEWTFHWNDLRRFP